jgi:hypothetical protein
MKKHMQEQQADFGAARQSPEDRTTGGVDSNGGYWLAVTNPGAGDVVRVEGIAGGRFGGGIGLVGKLHTHSGHRQNVPDFRHPINRIGLNRFAVV